MLVATYNKLGDIGRTPQDIRDIRQSNYDFHRKLGMPVVHKHRWNFLDQRKGLAQVCPFHDIAYGRDETDCQYCFGTGFLGGFADGVITFVTIADAPTDTINIGEGGILQLLRNPQLSAPWTPDLGDGDIIITADFEPDTWDVIETRDRYVLDQVTPISIRGFQDRVQTVEFKVDQKATIDRLPYNHPYYNVPIEFDYDSVVIPDRPPGGDPDDYPGGEHTRYRQDLHITGIPAAGRTQASYGLRITGYGTNLTATYGLRMNQYQGVVVNF